MEKKKRASNDNRIDYGVILPVFLLCLIGLLSLYVARKDKEGSSFRLSNAIPWFIGGFILTTGINTSGFLPVELAKMLGSFGKFLIVVAMVGIGLNTNLGQLIRNGARPILLGFICWFVLSVVSLAVQHQLGIM